MKRTATASSTLALPFGLCLLALGACGGSSSAVGEAGIGGFGRGDFQVVRTAPVNGATIFLNDPVSIDFSTPVDIDSATLSTMTFQALDQQGNPISELVTGTFSVGRANGDDTIANEPKVDRSSKKLLEKLLWSISTPSPCWTAALPRLPTCYCNVVRI